MTNTYSKKVFLGIIFFAIFTIFSFAKISAQTTSSTLPKIRINEISADNKNNESVEGVIKISNLDTTIVPQYYLTIELDRQIESTSTERITKTI